jgi:hypothetical protein
VDVTFRLTPEMTALIVSEAAKAARRHPRIATAPALVAVIVAGPFGPQRTRLNRDRAKAFGHHIIRALIHLLETPTNSSHEIAASPPGRFDPGRLRDLGSPARGFLGCDGGSVRLKLASLLRSGPPFARPRRTPSSR